MRVAKDLGKSIQEVMQFSVLELKLWSAYYKMEYDDQKKVMNNGGQGPNRNKRRR